MGAGASLLPDRADALNFDEKDNVEWLYIIREALKHEELQARMVSFLKRTSTSSAERNCVRLYIELDKLSACCKRATRYLDRKPKPDQLVEKMLIVRRDISRVLGFITNTHVVVDAKRRVQLSRAVIHQFGLLTNTTYEQGEGESQSHHSAAGAGGDSRPAAERAGSISIDRRPSAERAGSISQDPENPRFFGVYSPKDLRARMLEVQKEVRRYLLRCGVTCIVVSAAAGAGYGFSKLPSRSLYDFD